MGRGRRYGAKCRNTKHVNDEPERERDSGAFTHSCLAWLMAASCPQILPSHRGLAVQMRDSGSVRGVSFTDVVGASN